MKIIDFEETLKNPCISDAEQEHAYLCVMVIQCYAGCCRHTSLSCVRRRLLSTSVLSALHPHPPQLRQHRRTTPSAGGWAAVPSQ
ncbi:hypothetical protein CesoFtcFv8_020700 [Champsocephalus esox]|uniref:Uncharacterized protein n=1 Tax=Champsocephalus esox TaxID=159716 RepID=A0AAN8BCP5_9TELE|nr:hypothetical protein CesoFtcFv8_020700 [Champsocephalus esox]